MREMISKLLEPIRIIFFRLLWRKQNAHNTTRAKNRFHLENVRIGKETYGPIEILYDAGTGRLEIGSYCSIADNVKFFLGGGHDYRRISTWPFQTKVYKGANNKKRDGSLDVKVEDDVWIGYDVIVLAGSVIGKGSVIGARSIVSGVVPPYSVYVGNRVIKKRFSDTILDKIEKIDYSSVNHHLGDKYQKYCTERIDESNVDEIMNFFISNE